MRKAIKEKILQQGVRTEASRAVSEGDTHADAEVVEVIDRI